MIKRILSVIFLIVLLQSCIEELEIDTLVDEIEAGMLVVEATFTDKMETQRVILSRSVERLDIETDTTYIAFRQPGQELDDTVEYEENATVRVMGSDGSSYSFVEQESGNYVSQAAFALQSGVDYKLEIATLAGIEYKSDNVRIPDVSQISNVYADYAVSDSGVEGVQIYVDSEPVSGSPSNFRYTYEETYKIVAPYWNENDFELSNYDPCALPEPTYDLEIVSRETQNQVCYNTVPSNTVIQGTSVGSGNTVKGFPVRFIGRDNYIIANRYSILVRQHVQGAEAYGYYETLKELSESDNVFSQVQPGPLEANVVRSDGSEEMVLGYVDATTISEYRLFFEFDDFFPGEALPEYPYPCFEESSPESHVSYCFTGEVTNMCPLSTIERVNTETITYTGLNDDNIGECPGPYTFVSRICGDCTLLGNNVVPEFWEE